MKKELQEKRTLESDPRELLERVLSTEIEIAGLISDTREQADKRLIEAQANTTKLKNLIIEKARKERDQLFAEGREKALERAEKSVESAAVEAREFLAKGQIFVPEASSQVINLLLGLEGREQI